MENDSHLTLEDIFDIMEEKYGFDCELEEVVSVHPEDTLMRYYQDRITQFKVWEEQKALYDSLDLIAKTRFIMLTDKYGKGWRLCDLLREHPDDDLPKAFDSYLDYMDRVWSLYSYSKKIGYKIDEL